MPPDKPRVHDTTGSKTGRTTGWKPVECLFTRCSRLFNRFDNLLYRVNGVFWRRKLIAWVWSQKVIIWISENGEKFRSLGAILQKRCMNKNLGRCACRSLWQFWSFSTPVKAGTRVNAVLTHASRRHHAPTIYLADDDEVRRSSGASVSEFQFRYYIGATSIFWKQVSGGLSSARKHVTNWFYGPLQWSG